MYSFSEKAATRKLKEEPQPRTSQDILTLSDKLLHSKFLFNVHILLRLQQVYLVAKTNKKL